MQTQHADWLAGAYIERESDKTRFVSEAGLAAAVPPPVALRERARRKL
jgi:hypothetical protein